MRLLDHYAICIALLNAPKPLVVLAITLLQLKYYSHKLQCSQHVCQTKKNLLPVVIAISKACSCQAVI